MGGKVTIKNTLAYAVSFKINPAGKWNVLQPNAKHKYKTYGTFTGYVRDEADNYESSSRTGMNPKGKYCIIETRNKVQLANKNHCSF